MARVQTDTGNSQACPEGNSANWLYSEVRVKTVLDGEAAALADWPGLHWANSATGATKIQIPLSDELRQEQRHLRENAEQ